MDTITAKHGTQVYYTSTQLSSKIIKNVTLKVIKGAPHGMCTMHKNRVNEDSPGFLKA